MVAAVIGIIAGILGMAGKKAAFALAIITAVAGVAAVVLSFMKDPGTMVLAGFIAVAVVGVVLTVVSAKNKAPAVEE